MTATVSKAGPYYASGEIKFSSLRSNFRAQVRKETSSGSETFNSDTSEIKASDFRRNVSINDTAPIVPDATENAEISTSNNWKTSQFRGSIKYYYITQSDFDENFNISSPSSATTWNENLNKNIRKFLFVDGTCGSENVISPAIQLNTTAYNLTLDVRGSILGAGGRGGSSSGNITSKTYTRIPLIRYFNPTTGDHYCTTSIGNPPPDGYLYENQLGTVFREQAPGTYGGYDNNDDDFSQEGFPYSGILGYVYSTPAPDRQTILQVTNSIETMWTDLATNEYLSLLANGGYIETGPRFYLPTSDVTVSSGQVIVSSGENGGDALDMSSPNGKNNIVLVRPGSQIYGGGGGGEQGSAGSPGNPGSCYEETTYQGCGEVQSCPDGYTSGGTWGGRCCESTCDWCFGCCERCTKNLQYRSCYKTTPSTPGLGGAGGAGGNGRGYNNLEPGILRGYPGQLGKEPSGVPSTIGYYWTTDADDAYLNVTGAGRARITVEIRTKDNPNTAGTSYDTVRIYDGPNTGSSLIQTWGFDNGIRNVSFDVTPKTYMVRISGNPRNVQIVDNGVKLRDNDGNDTNARIYVTDVDQYTVSAGEVCGATKGNNGQDGGSGGDWASPGSETLAAGGPGGPGRAIFGSNYTIEGTINSSTIKGQR